MIPTIPSVQKNIRRRRKDLRGSRLDFIVTWKRMANRKYRRSLNRITTNFILNPSDFDNETFVAPSLNSWDIW